MSKPTSPILGITLAGVLALTVTTARADTFGSGPSTFTIDFVTIGNPGNPDDSGTTGSYFSPYGGVPYVYRMGVTEAPQDWIDKATAINPGGLSNVTAGAWPGSQPAANLTWYEAAAFVNWLNTSTGRQAAYNLTWTGTAWTMGLWSGGVGGQAWQLGGENRYRHKNAYYFLPSEDEWYKAAFHQNDGVTANYWDYATGSNSIPTPVPSGTSPDTAVYNGVTLSAAAVNDNGGLSAYGTRGQNGNVWEWNESALDGTNDSSSETRAIRGAYWFDTESDLRSSHRDLFGDPASESSSFGLRVASVPEPSSTVLMLGSGLVFLARRRRERSL